MKKVVLVLIFLSSLSHAGGFLDPNAEREIKLFTIGMKDDPKSSVPIRLVVDGEGTAKGMKYFSPTENKELFIKVSHVLTEKGFPIIKHMGHNLAYLKSNDMEADRGGHLKLTYVKNVLIQTTEDLEFKLDFDGENWAAFHDGEKVKQLEVAPGGLGISQIAVK